MTRGCAHPSWLWLWLPRWVVWVGFGFSGWVAFAEALKFQARPGSIRNDAEATVSDLPLLLDAGTLAILAPQGSCSAPAAASPRPSGRGYASGGGNP